MCCVRGAYNRRSSVGFKLLDKELKTHCNVNLPFSSFSSFSPSAFSSVNVSIHKVENMRGKQTRRHTLLFLFLLFLCIDDTSRLRLCHDFGCKRAHGNSKTVPFSPSAFSSFSSFSPSAFSSVNATIHQS